MRSIESNVLAVGNRRRWKVFLKNLPPPVLFAIGVRHNEHAIPLVRCSDVASAPYSPANRIPQRGKVIEHSTEVPLIASCEKTGRILTDEPLRADLSDNSCNLAPQVTLVTIAATFSRKAIRLARKPCRYDGNLSAVDAELGKPLICNCSYIMQIRNSPEIFCKHPARVLVDLALRDGLEPRPLRRKIQPADPCT